MFPKISAVILRIGAPDIAATLRATLKSRLTPLLEGAVANPFVYEAVWGGIVAHDSLLSVWIDCTCTAPFAFSFEKSEKNAAGDRWRRAVQ